jgi:hypothetical protein
VVGSAVVQPVRPPEPCVSYVYPRLVWAMDVYDSTSTTTGETVVLIVIASIAIIFSAIP